MSLLRIAYLETPFLLAEQLQEQLKAQAYLKAFEDVESLVEATIVEPYLEIDAVVLYGNLFSPQVVAMVQQIRQQLNLKFLPLVLIGDPINKETRQLALQYQVDDLFHQDVFPANLMLRLQFLVTCKQRIFEIENNELVSAQSYKIKASKRVFDIVFSSLAVILFSPLILVIAVMIKSSSKGAVLYASKRVGTGYRTFDFYKFRTMMPDDDSHVYKPSMTHQNNAHKHQISVDNESLCSSCMEKEIACQNMLFKDGEAVCEKLHKSIKKDISAATFIKVKGDPRITKVGQWLINTKMDELPQLFNVLIGDMSIVGNRPLSMYEAEQITTDKFIARFMAPAGMIGVWRANKEGKNSMTEEEKRTLDNTYTINTSLLEDIKIIFKSISTLFQR